MQASFDVIYQVNIKAAFLMMQHAIRNMVANGSGHIINIASTAGVRPFPTTAAYSASKAALISLTQSAAIEYAGNGLLINSISPGALERPNVQGWTEEVSCTLFVRPTKTDSDIAHTNRNWQTCPAERIRKEAVDRKKWLVLHVS